jgi:hypothetical protein
MGLHEAVERRKELVCNLLVDDEGFVLYNSCDEAII